MNGLNLPICMMFNYCRITSLACCIKDGTTIAKARQEKGDTTCKIPLTELNVNLKRNELVNAVEELPSFLDFLAYIYFCGASISGPWYEYRDFNDLINLQGDYSKGIPSTWRAALTRYLTAWSCVAFGSFFAYFFPYKYMLTDEFDNHSLLWKIFFTCGNVKSVMYVKYMIGWCLMEVGPIAAGLGFNGYDENGQPKFDRVKSCNIYKLETSYKVKDFLANWNMSVHHWLKHYIFLR